MMNQTWTGSFTSGGSIDSKAMKNMSHGVTNLIENRPMHSYSNQMQMEDTNRFMSLNLKKRKPIFKNYIQNNTSILRKEAQASKLKNYAEHERKQQSYLDKMSY